MQADIMQEFASIKKHQEMLIKNELNSKIKDISDKYNEQSN